MNATFREAGANDVAALLPMMRSLWEHEGIAFDEGVVRAALAELLADPSLGRVWLALAGGDVAGYAMGTWGFSTEQGGRFLLLDELFVLPGFRGRGIGTAALAFVEDAARGLGAGAVRIEVAEENRRARELYRVAGWVDPRRLFLAKRLAPAASSRRPRPERVEGRVLVRAEPGPVWEALATARGLDGWFTNGASVDPRPGGRLVFRWERRGPDEFTGACEGTVLEARPPRRFAFRWPVDARTYETTVEIDLEARGGATLVSLVEHGFAEGPAGLKEMLGRSSGWGEALALMRLFVERGLRA